MIKKIASLLLPIFIVFGILGCKENNNVYKAEPTVYEKVLATNTIRVGYISYPPSFIMDANSGELSGIFYDVIVEVSKNLGLKLEFVEEVSWGTMIESLSTNRVDIVVAGIWPTSSRGLRADFTVPLYYSSVRAYTDASNNSFDGMLNNINQSNITIATIDGEMTSIIADMDYPNAKKHALAQMTDVSQVLLEVASKKANVTFVERAIAEEYISKNPNKIKEVQNVGPVRVFPNVMVIKKGEIELQSTMNTAITELINNGFVDKVITKYEKYPNSFERVALPYLK